MSSLDSLAFFCRRRVYGGSCQTSPFRRFPSSLSCRFALQAWQVLMFSRVCKSVCGRRNTFASFSEDELQFLLQVQHFGDLNHPPSSFCVAGAALQRCVFFTNIIVRAVSSGDNVQNPWQTWHVVTCADTPHSTPLLSTLHTSQSALYTPHTTLHTPHFTLYTPHSTLYTLRSTHHTPHFTLHTLRSTLYTLHSTVYTLQFRLHTPHFTLYTAHFTLHTPHFTLHTLRSTLCTLHSPLYTLHSTLYTLHSTLYTLHFKLHTPHFTLYTLDSALYTPHSTVYTLHSTLHTLHFTLHSPYLALHPLPHSTVYSVLVRKQGKMHTTVQITCFTKVFYVTAFGFVGCILLLLFCGCFFQKVVCFFCIGFVCLYI